MKTLDRSLALPEVVAISMGAMLGSGIFVLPGLAAAKAGTMLWIAYLLAGICVLPAALSKSELATAMPTSGGTYVYLERAFGPLIGTISGFGLWLSLVLKSAFALVGFSAYLLVLVDFPLIVTSLTLLGLIMFLNIIGVRKVGRAQVIAVCITLVGLGLLDLAGVMIVGSTDIELNLPAGYYGILSATAFVFVSFAGVTKIAAIAEEVHDPGRNLPLGMMISLGIVTAVYVCTTWLLTSLVPISDLTGTMRPIYFLGQSVGGSLAGTIAAVIAVLTMTSMANSGLLAASRFPFAMSRDHLLPQIFRRVHHRFVTPTYCIALSGLLMAIIIVFIDPVSIAKLASSFQILMYMGVNISLIVLRETGVQWYRPSYRSPLYPGIQVFGVLSGALLLLLLGMQAIAATASIILTGLAVFLLYGRRFSDREGVAKLYGHRAVRSLLSGRYRDQHRERFEQRVIEKRSTLEESLSTFDTAVDSDAAVIVPLFGLDRSPEMLIEIGAALANGRRMKAAHITEIPDQTLLDAVLEDDPVVLSLERRFRSVTRLRNLDFEFDAIVTHDVVRTVRGLSERFHCSWMVMGWDGRAGEGLLVRNPIGWLIHHLPCNLALFKDSGVRYIREILFATQDDTENEILIETAEHLAEIYEARVTLIEVVSPEASVEREAGVQAELAALQKKFGCETKQLLLKGTDRIELVLRETSNFDLLITGRPPESGILSSVLGVGKDRLTEGAACSVLRVSRPYVSVQPE